MKTYGDFISEASSPDPLHGKVFKTDGHYGSIGPAMSRYNKQTVQNMRDGDEESITHRGKDYTVKRKGDDYHYSLSEGRVLPGNPPTTLDPPEKKKRGPREIKLKTVVDSPWWARSWHVHDGVVKKRYHTMGMGYKEEHQTADEAAWDIHPHQDGEHSIHPDIEKARNGYVHDTADAIRKLGAA